MSSTIFVFAQASLASVTPEALVRGTQERLAVLTYLFCPDEEEDPDEAAKRLRVKTNGVDLRSVHEYREVAADLCWSPHHVGDTSM